MWNDGKEALPIQAVERRGGQGADWRHRWIWAARAWAVLRDTKFGGRGRRGGERSETVRREWTRSAIAIAGQRQGKGQSVGG